MKPFRITRLEVHQVGPFGDLILDFPEKPRDIGQKAEVHILTGENGTGKTTALEMLAGGMANQINNSLRGKLRPVGSHFKIGYSEENKEYWMGFHIDSKQVNLGSPTWRQYWHARNNLQTDLFPIAFFAYSGYRRVDQVNVSSIQELTNHPMETALNFQESINPNLLTQWIANTISKEAIEKSQGNGGRSQRFRDALTMLEKSISTIISKPVHFYLDTDPFNVIIKVAGEKLDFNQIPDGLKSIISWIADLLMRMDRIRWVNDIPVFERNFILFLDEIEVHLHPAWQRKILPAVQSLFPNAQIFISTQSPFVVGSVDGAWIHKLVKPNGDGQLAAGFPVLSEDEKTYDYWLEEVFDIHTPYGPEAAKVYERRRELLQKQDISSSEQHELESLNKQFELISTEGTPLRTRIVEHLKKLKSNPT